MELLIENDFTVIDAQDSLSTLIKERSEVFFDMDSGFIGETSND